MLYKVEGIVIRSMDYGEGNKIITLFSKEAGKVSVMVRGAKKLKSRHSAAAQLFTYGEYVFYKSGQMGTLNHAEIVQSHHILREDLRMAAYCSYVSELTDRMLDDSETNLFLFEQCKAAFQAMADGKDPEIIVHIYEMKMLAFAGYMPELEQCVSCGEPSEEMVFSVSMGGILCGSCKNKDIKAYELSGTLLKLLRLFAKIDIRRLGQTDVKEQTKLQLKMLIRAYMDAHMGVQLKSRSFLEQMEKYGF